MQERLQEWSVEVADEYIDENEIAETVEALGGPDEETALEAINWSNNVDHNGLLFMLAICVSEVVRRFGVEATNITLSKLLESPAIAAIGDIVHAYHQVDVGEIPERFQAEDMEATLRAKLQGDDGYEATIINMDTGEIL